MPRKNLPYVNSYKDRTGKMRYYLRRPGCRQVALVGVPGTREFAQSYAAVSAAPAAPKKVRIQRKQGQIYYLSDGDHVKIGFTTNWSEREKKYRTHTPRPLTLLAIRPGTHQEETRLHHEFRRYRANGEWFYPGPELVEHIKRTVDELNAA